MRHRPWPYVQRLVERMADSSLQDQAISIQRPPRSAGLHASELLRVLHPYDAQGDDPITPEQLKIYGLLGLAFEDRCETALLSLADDPTWPFEATRIGEVEHDGIACSPDVMLVPKDGGHWQELSIKVTWRSCKGQPIDSPKFAYYVDQCQTYATPLDTFSAVVLAYFVNGDYRGNRAPQIHAWELTFSARERQETWQSLLNLRRQREETCGVHPATTSTATATSRPRTPGSRRR